MSLLEGMKARVRAMETAKAGRRPEPTQKAPEAKRFKPQRAVVDDRPAHVCGTKMVRCDDCAEWVCRAPGHELHVCRAYSQEVAP